MAANYSDFLNTRNIFSTAGGYGAPQGGGISGLARGGPGVSDSGAGAGDMGYARGGLGKKPRSGRKAARRARKALNQGIGLAHEIAPDLFDKGLGHLDYNKYKGLLDANLADAQGMKGSIASDYDELTNLRRGKLGGLMADENTALRDSAYRQLDRGLSRGLRDVAAAQASGQGTGASFAQRRALERDFGENRAGLEQNILLANVDAKNKALDSFEATQAAKQAALSGANQNIANIRGQQLSTQTGIDQFNLGQDKDTLAAQIGAISAGVGLFKDEKDQLQAQQQLQQMLDFIKEQEATKFNQLQGLL